MLAQEILARIPHGGMHDLFQRLQFALVSEHSGAKLLPIHAIGASCSRKPLFDGRHRSEEHTSELQSLMRISYAEFCLKKKKTTKYKKHNTPQGLQELTVQILNTFQKHIKNVTDTKKVVRQVYDTNALNTHVYRH